MNAWVGERPIHIVSAVMTANGTPAFAATTVSVTHEQYENGVHYYLAEAELLERDYEEPFVHFDEREAPSFLIAAVAATMAVPDLIIDPGEQRHAVPLNAGSVCPIGSAVLAGGRAVHFEYQPLQELYQAARAVVNQDAAMPTEQAIDQLAKALRALERQAEIAESPPCGAATRAAQGEFDDGEKTPVGDFTHPDDEGLGYWVDGWFWVSKELAHGEQ